MSPESVALDRPQLLTDQDLYLFNEGRHYRFYDKLGAHLYQRIDGNAGTSFSVWAPNARQGFGGWQFQ